MLSITEGSDGTLLIKCFAGCTALEFVRAVGLELDDLFPRAEWRTMGLVVRVSSLEPSGNLLRRPQQLELTCHDAGQASIPNQLTRLGELRPVSRRLIGLTRPIAFLASVALEFSADGGMALARLLA